MRHKNLQLLLLLILLLLLLLLLNVKKILAVINATYAVAKRKPGFLFATA